MNLRFEIAWNQHTYSMEVVVNFLKELVNLFNSRRKFTESNPENLWNIALNFIEVTWK